MPSCNTGQKYLIIFNVVVEASNFFFVTFFQNQASNINKMNLNENKTLEKYDKDCSIHYVGGVG